MEELTKDQLFEIYKNFKNYYMCIKNLKISKKRLPNFNELISENIIKFIIRNNGTDCKNGNIGDLCSVNEGIQECKCFASTGPISFGPCTKFDIIYFLDATKFIEDDKIILYKVKMNKKDFDNIKVSKTETFGEQCKNKRRPRLSWKLLYPQIEINCSVLYNGSIYDI